MRVAYVQMRPEFGRVRENVERAIQLMCREKADLFVLPELFHTGYVFADRKEARSLAEDAFRGATVRELCKVARARHCHVVAGICERAGEQVFNSAVVVGPDGVLGVYRKLHLFWDEKDIFDAGDLGAPVFELPECRIGVLICFDWIFPEVSRALALAGAEVLAHPSNLVLPYAQRAMRTRALENRVFTVTANRVGVEERAGKRLAFTGASQITATDGEVLAQAGTETEEVGVAEIDVSRARDKWFTPRNHLFEDRRPEFYTALVQRVE
ncbi:MAG: acyltransferase [candidate division KSB1 bacterium]|nr:acyltransferase [candidate division KSB1 bacterium]